MENIKLSDIEFDALREVGNVGVGNAVTALSRILNKKIAIDIPDTSFVLIKKFADVFGGAERIVTTVFLKVSGDLTGETFFFFTKENALKLADLMMSNPEGMTQKFDDMSRSAFQEMSNIFSGAYLSALSNMLGYKIYPGVPYIMTDMLQAVIDGVLSYRSLFADDVLCIKTNINVEGQDVEGDFVVMFDKSSLEKVIKTLHDKFGMGETE